MAYKRSLKVFYRDPDTGYIVMKFGELGIPEETSGTYNLLEKIVKYLLTATLSGLANLNEGCALGDPAALAPIINDPLQLKIRILDSIDKCQKYITANQDSNLEKDELLDKLVLGKIIRGTDDPTTILVEIFVYTKSGKQFIITV